VVLVGNVAGSPAIAVYLFPSSSFPFSVSAPDMPFILHTTVSPAVALGWAPNGSLGQALLGFDGPVGGRARAFDGGMDGALKSALGLGNTASHHNGSVSGCELGRGITTFKSLAMW
jgi:hypothetical protein